MSQVEQLTKTNFREVVGSGQKVLVDFWAPWCGPCRLIGPELDAIAVEVGDRVRVAKVNVDEEPEIAEAYGIQSIPNLIVFQNGNPVRQLVGFRDRRELLQALS